MILAEDSYTTPENSSSPLNDLSALKNLPGREQASTSVAIAMVELVTVSEGSKTFSLANLKLHSPSAIIGTPLDPSSRFEYPFPSPQLESNSRNPSFLPSKPENPPPIGPTSSVRSLVHPDLDVRQVPIPPTLKKWGGIELRFPRPAEEADVLGKAQASIRRRRRGNVGDPAKKS